MKEMKKIYVTESEFNKIENALETLKLFDNLEEVRKNINYELPVGIVLGEIVDALDLILEMSEVVNNED